MKRIRRKVLTLCAVSSLWLSATLWPWEGSANVRAFWSSVDNALARHPAIHRSAAELRAAEESDPQSLAKLLPTANLQASKTLDEETRYRKLGVESNGQPSQVGVNVTQPLINFANWIGREQSAPHIEAAAADLDAAKQNLVLQVATLTANWLQAKEVYELGESYRQVTDRHVRVVHMRFKAGESTETEVHEAASRASQAEASLLTARNTLDQAAASYAELVGEEPTPELVLPEFTWEKPARFEERLAEFVEGRADIRAARLRMKEFDLGVDAKRAEHAPSMRLNYIASRTWDSELGGTSGRSVKDDVDSQSLMVYLDVPLFNGFATASKTRQAQAEWEGRVAEVDRLRLLALREAQQARLDMESTHLSTQSLEKALESSTRALHGLEEQFLVGTRTLLDLLDAQYEKFTVQTNLVRNRYQHQLARIRLWSALGWTLAPDPAVTVVAKTVHHPWKNREETATSDAVSPPLSLPLSSAASDEAETMMTAAAAEPEPTESAPRRAPKAPATPVAKTPAPAPSTPKTEVPKTTTSTPSNAPTPAAV
ncbi:MAG: TolC family protein, partial [Magnetococcales bacterium]|nr:TolC family protein [Magnetococcales bacterium]